MGLNFWDAAVSADLKRRVLWSGLWFFLGWGAVYLWLRGRWPAADRWGLVALGTAAAALIVLWRHLPDNHREGETSVLPTLGLGNGLTLTRGFLLALMTGFLVVPRPEGWLAWLPVLFYTLASILDFLDGLAARLTDHATRLGEILDLEYDSYGVGLVVLLAIHFDQVGWWFLTLALARYLFVAGSWWRRRHGRPLFDLTPSRYRRLIAGYNMGFLTVVLWPILSPEAAAVGGAIFLPPLLLIFGRDWLVVSGRLDPSLPAYQTWRRRIIALGAGWLPFVLRLGIAGTMLTSGVLPIYRQGHPAWRGLFASWGWVDPWVTWAAVALGWLALVVLTAVVLGLWARWLALVAILPTAINLVAIGVSWSTWDSVFLGSAVCTIAILNSGRWSLRRPAEDYMFRPIGAEKTSSDAPG